MSVFRLSDKELETLLAEGQHSVLHEVSLSLNVPASAKKAIEPDTEASKALKRATRNRLQDAFINTWLMVGGAYDYWTPEYKFHPDRKWRFDFANVADQVAVEVNGGQWQKSGHSSGAGLRRDAEKLNAAQLLGWKVYVFTTDMLHKRVAADNVRRLIP